MLNLINLIFFMRWDDPEIKLGRVKLRFFSFRWVCSWLQCTRITNKKLSYR